LKQREKHSAELERSLAAEVSTLEQSLAAQQESHRSELRASAERLAAGLESAKCALEKELQAAHEKEVNALRDEIAAVETRHKAAIADAALDRELAVEEEKLTIYAQLRRQCDQQIEDIEAQINEAKRRFDVDMAEVQRSAEMRREQELKAQGEAFDAAAKAELCELSSRLASMQAAHTEQVRHTAEEHAAAVDKARREVEQSVEQKHGAEKKDLLATLAGLKENLAADLLSCRDALLADIDSDVSAARRLASAEHQADIADIEDQIAQASTRFDEEVKFTAARNSNHLSSVRAAARAQVESEYLNDMCRISDEIDMTKVKQAAVALKLSAAEERNAKRAVMVDAGAQTDAVDPLVADEPSGEDALPPPDYTASVAAQMDGLRQLLKAEHEAVVDELNALHSSKIIELKKMMQLQLSDASKRAQEAQASHEAELSDLEAEMQSVKLQLADVKYEEAKALEISREKSITSSRSVAAVQAELAEMKEEFVRTAAEHRLEADALRSTIEQLSAARAHTTETNSSATAHSKVLRDEEIANLLDVNSRLQEHIADLELVTENKFTECERLTAQIQSMFRLIALYKGQGGVDVDAPSGRPNTDASYGEYTNSVSDTYRSGSSNTAEISSHQRNIVYNHSVESAEGHGIAVDGVLYSSSQLLAALKKTVKQKNSAQSMCRQQQLCIMALR
jgi:hypothetical protein